MPFPTLALYREATLADSQLGGQVTGVVSADPDLYDAAAARSLISGSLFDSEKLSSAFGGHGIWIPRYSDSRRVEDRGFRVRYISVFAPPESGTYRLKFYGLGESQNLAAQSPASAVQAACRAISPDLINLTVHASSVPGQLIFNHQFRTSMGSTSGEMIANGGVGVLIVSRDFTQALTAGEPWCMTAKLPFEDEDDQAGIHTCIRLALFDILIEDLYPVTPTEDTSTRDHVITLSEIAPFIRIEDVVGYYAPTNWVYAAEFAPPAAGSYSLTVTGWDGEATTPVLLPYNADGTGIEAALRQVPLWSQATVTPQGAASRYQISLKSMYASWQLAASSGVIWSQENRRIDEPLPVSIAPYYRSDFESSTLVDPGYQPGQTWFIHFRRRALSRVCPQTYPRKADGSLDRTARPIAGTVWVDSTTGPQHDLDQCVPPVHQVAELAVRYAYAAIAATSPRGEADPWTAAGRLQAAVAAGKVVYGPIKKRGTQVPAGGGTWSLVGQKGRDWWLP